MKINTIFKKILAFIALNIITLIILVGLGILFTNNYKSFLFIYVMFYIGLFIVMLPGIYQLLFNYIFGED